MKRISGAVIVVLGIVVLIAAVSGGSAKNVRIAPASALTLKATSFGKTLADANGRTLYLFQADKGNLSTLSNAGLVVWPALRSAGPPRAGSGVNAALIGTTTGSTGVRQVTYNGHPLYYYVGDQNPGSTRGQRLNQFGALWYVLAPSGNAVTSAPSSPPPAAAAPSASSGY